ncbi:hypothetical protein PFLmoz3_03993 [Pseudomonas fluorescens]|uniref:Uncharacterized protein n=1 Tax=Pseudomonas fluorescens TaxID=294 RepID=A0A109LEW0_PSEFL|nr:hypothetical protein PFLmoz3_03993 [Pseudomonas fluorescens]
MGDLRLDHIAAVDRGEVVAYGPILGLMLDINIEFAGLEGFKGHVAVAIELHFDLVVVIETLVDRQVFAPVILDPFKHQLPPRRNLGDAVRPTAQGRLEGGCLEVTVFPIVLGQHRQLAQAQDQQGVAGALEHKADTVRVEDIDPGHFLQVGAVLRVAFGQQGAIGKRHVSGGDRLAVVKACFGAQVEHHPTAVFAVFHRLGNQAVA